MCITKAPAKMKSMVTPTIHPGRTIQISDGEITTPTASNRGRKTQTKTTQETQLTQTTTSKTLIIINTRNHKIHINHPTTIHKLIKIAFPHQHLTPKTTTLPLQITFSNHIPPPSYHQQTIMKVEFQVLRQPYKQLLSPLKAWSKCKREMKPP